MLFNRKIIKIYKLEVDPLEQDVFVQDSRIEDVKNQNQVEDHLNQVQH